MNGPNAKKKPPPRRMSSVALGIKPCMYDEVGAPQDCTLPYLQPLAVETAALGKLIILTPRCICCKWWRCWVRGFCVGVVRSDLSSYPPHTCLPALHLAAALYGSVFNASAFQLLHE